MNSVPRDLLAAICSYCNLIAIQSLACASRRWQLAILAMLDDEHFFYLATTVLMSHQLSYNLIMDWRRAYTSILTSPVGQFIRSEELVEHEVMKILLHCGHDPTQPDRLLLRACLSGCVESVQLLLEDGRIYHTSRSRCIGEIA